MPKAAIKPRPNTTPVLHLRLHNALAKLAKMKSPSIAQILEHQGYEFESGTVAEVVNAFEEVQP